MENQFPNDKERSLNNQSSEESLSGDRIEQTAKAQGNIYQSAGNFHYQSKSSTKSTTVNLLISLFLISILALGGVWALNAAGLIKGSGNPQAPQPTALPPEKI
jgi:hypothetical protein